MFAESLYPAFLSLQGQKCLLAGFGQVGRRKLKGILACDPLSVLVLDIRPLADLDPEARELLANPKVSYAARPCREEDVRASFLVFAAAGDARENARIASLCRSVKTLCNCATDPALGSFIVPGVARKENLTIALSTSGQSPMLAAKWRRDLEAWLEPKTHFGALLGRLRPIALESFASQGEREAFFREVLASPLEEWLNDSRTENCLDWLAARLPHAQRAQLLKILTGK